MNSDPPCCVYLQQGGIFLEQKYDVILGSEAVGNATVMQQGLYYHIHCKCKLSGQVICCLIAESDGNRINLGTLVPEAGHFLLNKSIPVKRLGQAMLRFSVEPKHQKMDPGFVPIRSDEPFVYLSALTGAYLCRHNGEIGIVIDTNKSGL